ncbi:MAG: hypothetical protein HDS06_01495 [Bacteroides sp.]|nr:hypothetical protein [Bacteroides sp.]
MQKSLLFFGIAAGALFMPVAANSANSRQASKVRQVLAAANQKAAAMSAEAVARLYHPQTVTAENYNSYENLWSDPYTTKFTYNKAGQILTQTEGDRVTKYTYNEAGYPVKVETFYIIDGENKLSSVNEYTYDTVVKGLVIKEASQSYDPWTGESYGGGVSGVEITRNSDGNITKLQEYYEDGDHKSYYDALIIEYGADKKAVKISEVEDDEVYITISDIVWNTTDGQITTYEFDDPNGDMYFSNNRIASATITDEDNYPVPGKFTATYDGDSYHSKLMVGDDVALEIDFKCIEKFAANEDFDEQYSYDCTSFEAEYEFDEDTNKYFIEYTRQRTEENRANAFGFNLSNKRTTTYKYANPSYEDETEVEESKMEVTYDDEIGYPLTAVTYYTSTLTGGQSGELVPSTRYTYSDYVNVEEDNSGLTAPVVDESAEAEYYNLQGIRVYGDLTPGIYICRKGSETSKVIIR